MKSLVFVLIVIQALTVQSQSAKPLQSYKLIAGKSYVQSKNYYLLTLLEEKKEVRQLIESDEVFAAIAKAKTDSLSTSLKNCGQNSSCYIKNYRFSDAEIEIIGERLFKLYSNSNALGNLVRKDLVPSGQYVLYQSLSPAEFLRKAWEQDAKGINFTIGVYAEGKKPNYPNIDSSDFKFKSPTFYNSVYTYTYEIANSVSGSKLFFLPSLTAALRYLEYNERNDAGDLEPMTAGVNAAAFKRVATTDFKKYPYSLILVPGAGPDQKEVALSAEAMVRMRLAVMQYNKGMAPFILVSGGRVHPYKTKYNEAIEMKRYLIETLHVPAYAILVDPHARHTTTNLRNTARIIFRYGMPFDKPVLTSTSRAQSLSISNALLARCKAELNTTPFRVGKRLSETEVEIYPLLEALQIDPEEPMDP